MKILLQCLVVGCAGFAGAVSRFLVAIASAKLLGTAFPFGTMIVNLSGSVVLGFFLTMAQDRYPFPETLKIGIATGFVGAYTTFSTLMFESVQLMEEGAQIKAFGNLVGSFILGMVAVWLGIGLARRI